MDTLIRRRRRLRCLIGFALLPNTLLGFPDYNGIKTKEAKLQTLCPNCLSFSKNPTFEALVQTDTRKLNSNENRAKNEAELQTMHVGKYLGLRKIQLSKEPSTASLYLSVATCENVFMNMYTYQGLRSACASTQFDHSAH